MDHSRSTETPRETPAEELFDRYLAGETTAAETGVLRAHLSEYPNAERTLKQLARLHVARHGSGGAMGQPADTPLDVQALWGAVNARITGASGSPKQNRTHRFGWNRHGYVRMITSTAVGLVLLIAIGFVAKRSNGYMDTLRSVTHTAASTTRSMVTRPGQRSTIRLPDGSSVSLAPGTTLRYSTDFATTDRTVDLDGEALFTITHNDGAPFIVRTGHSAIRVLGTTFAVRQYSGIDSTTNVTVAQGKVSVGGQAVTSGEIATVSLSGSVRIERGADMSRALAWTTGSLVYQQVALRQMIPELERWYGIDITVVSPQLLDRRVSAVFLVKSPGEALDILASVLRANIVRQGTTATITPME